ncbi:hypothetical protein [Endozoicomonas euniceicola]|uniref:Uncharacterized protein n=1 Tax=Endozoicomonas euniceicola TaxID=1234143 RepID=A0ABY6GTR4_9GAMM|nr:hypothetical protein [Endozoicomonas euniceicola]UYM15349.1 hypothetical protein NX720_21230 [Endozoicomonas euniceicola]
MSIFDAWASELGNEAVYQWLKTPLDGDNESSLPFALFTENAHAIWWFIKRAIPEEDLTPDNNKLKTLALMAIRACNDNSGIIERLLNSAFSINSSHVLGEALLNMITVDGFYSMISLNYRNLIKTALENKNYRLVNRLLELIKPEDIPDHIESILSNLVAQPAIWEDFSADLYSEHPLSEPGRLLTWLQNNQLQNPVAFQEALAQARQARHSNREAIGWLTSIGIVEITPEPEPEAEPEQQPQLQLQQPQLQLQQPQLRQLQLQQPQPQLQLPQPHSGNILPSDRTRLQSQTGGFFPFILALIGSLSCSRKGP